eukprot:SAG22_NODE_7371_length_746_cov_2.034003_1_plen_36_part_10
MLDHGKDVHPVMLEYDRPAAVTMLVHAKEVHTVMLG